jgi:thiol-disulfide isomerase/thioredoxin
MMVLARAASLAAIVIFLVLGVAAAPAHAEVKQGDRAPELENAKTATGGKFRLREHRGKWVALTFGGSWCKPCKKELPQWDKLAAKYRGRVLFVAVNIDLDPAKGKKFLDGLKVAQMTRVFMPENKTTSVDSYDPGTFPSTFLVDPNGVVRIVHKGYESGDEAKMARHIDALLK